MFQFLNLRVYARSLTSKCVVVNRTLIFFFAFQNAIFWRTFCDVYSNFHQISSLKRVNICVFSVPDPNNPRSVNKGKLNMLYTHSSSHFNLSLASASNIFVLEQCFYHCSYMLEGVAEVSDKAQWPLSSAENCSLQFTNKSGLYIVFLIMCIPYSILRNIRVYGVQSHCPTFVTCKQQLL